MGHDPTARAPHFGRLWQAAVKSMKRHLRRIVSLQKLSYEELNTFIKEKEAISNSRPITAMSSDPNDLRPLTPAHFLIGTHMEQIPQGCKGKDITMNQNSSYWKCSNHHFGHHGTATILLHFKYGRNGS